jgi:hypothetical protein
MLLSFKQWLIERIEIIENANNLERGKIYNPNSFMMVDDNVKDQLITDVQDALYDTHQKFESNQMVVALNFEVIILLGYVYPEWKSKVGKNFVPLILDAISRNLVDEKSSLQSVELLKNICGLDGKDEVKEDIVNLAAKKDAVRILTKAISDKNYSDEYIKNCKPILKEIGKKEENLKDCYSDIDKLLKNMDDFIKSSPE